MVTRDLRIARGFTLPLDVVTEATAIVATRGAGKTSTSVVLIEEASAAGVQAVVFDRTGVYWGLQSSADGQSPGLPIYVLGGAHHDVPLEYTAGSMIADLVVDSGHSFVLDLSDFSKAHATRFAADFLVRIYDRKARSRTTTLMVMDEAHFYAPQTPRGGFKGDGARLMGAMEDVVGLGRSRGLGVVLTTQRTQALNKAVLDLIETMFVMRMLSPRARDAVKAWIQEKHEDDEKGVIATLDGLSTGTAWVWSPLRGILRRIDVRRIKTFDSYATPKPGETITEPTARQELDLDALGERIAATVERAKADDPTHLRARITELERTVTTLTREVDEARAEQPQPERVEVPVLDNGPWGERIKEMLGDLTRSVGGFEEQISNEVAELYEKYPPLEPAERPAPPAPKPRPAVTRAPAPAPAARRNPSAPADGSLSGPERKILTALTQHGPKDKITLAILTNYSHKGGAFNNPLGSLRSKGYVNKKGNPIEATPEGIDALGDYEPLPTGRALLEWWMPQLSGPERKIVTALDQNGPMDKAALAEVTGYSPSGGAFNNPLGHLRTLGIVMKGQPISLNPEMTG